MIGLPGLVVARLFDAITKMWETSTLIEFEVMPPTASRAVTVTVYAPTEAYA
jgi:hypothetical protein